MMTKEVRDYLALSKKKVVLDLAREFGSDAKSCRSFGVPRSTFYRWKKAFENEGEAGLVRRVTQAPGGAPAPAWFRHDFWLRRACLTPTS